MNEFPGITHIAVTVSDLARSTPWYADLFGFGGLQNVDRNILFGSRITVYKEDHKTDGSTTATVQPYYLYRLYR